MSDQQKSSFDLSFVLEQQLEAFLALRLSVLALQKTLEQSDPGFSKRYEANLAALAKDVSAQPNPSWTAMARGAFHGLKGKF